MLAGVTHRVIETNGIRLHCAEAGQGPPVVLLHGFPELWYSWRNQLPALAAAGFRAVAPDLRGYNQSDRPPRVRDYRTATLAADVADLIRHCGAPAFLVGHDWGGVLAWRVAALYPDLVRKLAVLNAPHPARFRALLRRSPGQWLRSSYVLFFQIPGLPERVLRARDFAMLARMWRRQPTRRDAFTPANVAEYKRALAVPGGLTGPLNYYRAALRYSRDLNGPPQEVAVPTLLIWGMRDPYLSPRLTEGLERWVPDLRVVRLPTTSHWVQNDEPALVNARLLEFFGPALRGPGTPEPGRA